MEENSVKHRGLWYTYFGEGGAGVFAFLWIISLLVWLIGVIWKG